MTIHDKLTDIYQDLSHNITFIYDRFDLLMAFDLAFHSVLSFDFQGKRIHKGWIESLIISDTRCGKSETADKLVNHYRLGEICSAENTSFAGLIGGMQQVGSRWHLSWGKIPINDRRLIVIDEVSGIDADTIALMSGIRASGIAEIIKINTEKTHARTRLIWLSNPRTAISVNSHNSGVEIVQRLIGKPEDIARFDFALVMAQEEVSSDIINAYQRDVIEHKYRSDLCHNLILWAWSRKPEQVIIDRDTTMAILDKTKMLCAKYSSEFPLVTVSEMKIKLARMSTALAARLFSTQDGENIIVNTDHVNYIAEWLDRIYSKPCFSYDMWSKRVKDKSTMNAEAVKMLLFGSSQLRECLLEVGQIHMNDIEEAIVGDRKEAKELLSQLMAHRALIKKHGFYVKTPAFIKLLREMGNGLSQTVTEELDPKAFDIAEMFNGEVKH